MNQIAFDPLDYPNGRAEAMKARNAEYKRLKQQGVKVTRFVLRGQLQKYSGFGCPDGRVRDVFYINIWK